MDRIFNLAMVNTGISIGRFNFSDLAYADDIAVIAHNANFAILCDFDFCHITF